MIYECDQCQLPLSANQLKCPRCGEVFDEPVPADAEIPAKGFTAKSSLTKSHTSVPVRNTRSLEAKQLIGLSGAVILFIGVFAPIINLPIVGGVNYFQNGKGDGTIIIGLAAISTILAITRRYTWLWTTACASLGLLAFTYLNLQAQLSGAQEAMGAELANNPFRGLGEAMVQSVQLQWGWALLVVGALLLLGSAAMKPVIESDIRERQNKQRIVPALSIALLALSIGGSFAYTQHEKAKIVNDGKIKADQAAKAKQQQQDAEQQAEADQQKSVQAEDQAKQDALNHLVLVSWNWESTDYSRSLVGTIRNDSNRVIDFPSINFDLLDKDGNKVGTAEDTIANLSPGEKWKFKAAVFQDGSLRATLDAIKGRAEDGPTPAYTPPDNSLSALPLTQLPKNTWPTPKKAVEYIAGKSLDKVVIGQLREKVLITAGRKPDNSAQLKDGSSLDTWTTNYRDKSGKFDNSIFISVVYRQGKVFQVELSNSDNILKLPSFNKLISNNKTLTKVCYGVDTFDEKGEASGGYVQLYYDDVRKGVAYGTETQDVFVLTSHPASVIIHAPNVPVAAEVANAKVRIDNGPESRTYRTQSEANKASF